MPSDKFLHPGTPNSEYDALYFANDKPSSQRDARVLVDGGMYAEEINTLNTQGVDLESSYRANSFFRNEQGSVYAKAAEEQLFEEFSEKSNQNEFDKSFSLLEFTI